MKTHLLVAACSVALSQNTDAENALVLIPDGAFKGLDGRPAPLASWVLTPQNGNRIATALNSQKIDMVIDWEHSTLLAKKDGGQAPAAGWCRQGKFVYTPGVGVCSTDWAWTPTAKSQIENEEYRYLSPVFLFDKDSGDVEVLLHASLTNTPNIDTMPEAMLAAASQIYSTQSTEDSTVDEILEQLRWMLNLPLSATAEEISAELAKLQERIKSEAGVEMAANTKTLFDALDAYKNLAIAANSSQIPDPTKYVPIEVFQGLQTKLAELKVSAPDEAQVLIQAACDDGRLAGASKEHLDWLGKVGESDVEKLKGLLETTPRIAALAGRQTQSLAANSRQQQTPSFDADTVAIAEQFGNDPADLVKYDK